MYKPHPLAEIFPPMSADELKALTDDIQTAGQVEPIILYEGKILDGVHRQKACLTAKIEPKYQEWAGEGGSPMAFVWSKNWNRRTLTPSQRAAVAVAAEAEFAKEGKERMSEGGKHKGAAKNSQPFRSRNAAAQLASVSPAYVQLAKEIQSRRPDLMEQVRLGKTTLSKAKKVAGVKQTNIQKRIKVSRNTLWDFEAILRGDNRESSPELTEYMKTLDYRVSIVAPHLRVEKENTRLVVVSDSKRYAQLANGFRRSDLVDRDGKWHPEGVTLKLVTGLKRIFVELDLYEWERLAEPKGEDVYSLRLFPAKKVD